MELTSWRRGVDALGQTDEGHAERLQIIEQRNQVLEIAAKPIETPAHEHVELAPLGIFQRAIKTGVLSLSRRLASRRSDVRAITLRRSVSDYFISGRVLPAT